MKAKIFRALLPLVMVLTLVSCSSDTTTDSNTSSTDKKVVTSYTYNDTELKLVTLINEYRESKGLNTLEVVNHISYKSEEHNVYMIDNNVVNHDYFQKRADNLMQVLRAENVGENIAYNYNTAESAFSAWLNSPSHKANIEGEFTHFGISVTIDQATGKKYFTNIFAKIK